MLNELIEEIQKYLTQFAHFDLVEGAQVRDCLLDLMLMAQKYNKYLDEEEEMSSDLIELEGAGCAS